MPESQCNLQLTVPGNGYTVQGCAEFAGSTLTGRINFVSTSVDLWATQDVFIINLRNEFG